MMLKRDSYYRSLCEFPAQYDAAIDWIKVNNPYCAKRPTEDEREDFAVNAVHSCIRELMWGSGKDSTHSGTGMVYAVRVSQDRSRPTYSKFLILGDLK